VHDLDRPDDADEHQRGDGVGDDDEHGRVTSRARRALR
jgi:hypothetical protein